jgi:hypothetical protein
LCSWICFFWLVGVSGKAGCPAGVFTSKIAPKAGLTVPDKLLVRADEVIDWALSAVCFGRQWHFSTALADR